MDFNFLAEKAYAPNAERADLDNLWAATFSLKEWYFIQTPNREPLDLFPYVSMMDGKKMILVFTDSDLLVKCAQTNEIYKQNEEIRFFTIPIASVIDYLAQFNTQGFFGVWFNPTVAYGYYAPLNSLTVIYNHLKSLGKL